MENRGSSYFHQAEKQRQKNEYDRAVDLYKIAHTVFKKTSDVDNILNCILSLGHTYRAKGNFTKAKKYYEEGIELAGMLEVAYAAADAQVGLALSLRALGDWHQALQLIRRAEGTYKKLRDPGGEAFSLWARAGTYRIQGDVNRAIRTYQESLQYFRKLKDRSGMAYSYCGLGGSSRVACHYKDSGKYYRMANRMFGNLKDRFGLAYSYCGLGNVHRMKGEYKEGLAFFSKAETLYKKIGDRVSYAYTLWSMATSSKMLGDLAKARRYFREADRLFRLTQDPRGRIYCILGEGEICYLEGQKKRASLALTKALKDADLYRFKVEGGYARRLLAALKSGKGFPFNLP